jgi:hypothetical protein
VEELKVFIGQSKREFVELSVLRRTHPTLKDFWDGNWLTCRVSIKAGAWSGSFEANLRAEEFESLRNQLEKLYGKVKGEAVFDARFEPLEPWINLKLRGDGVGHIIVEGEAVDHLGWGNSLRFRLAELDQTFLPDVISQVKEVEAAFPVVGRERED